jgi:hypothetical protein
MSRRMGIESAMAMAMLWGVAATADTGQPPRARPSPKPPRDPEEDRARIEAVKGKRAKKAAKHARIAARNAAKDGQP